MGVAMKFCFSKAFWESTESRLLLNPRMPMEEQNRLQQRIKNAGNPGNPGNHFWLATSGTTSQFKLIALSKEAILASAQAVNTHLEVSSQDRKSVV